jgi:hypothetical protein
LKGRAVSVATKVIEARLAFAASKPDSPQPQNAAHGPPEAVRAGAARMAHKQSTA